MSYWRDFVGVAKGLSLVSRAFVRDQSRVLTERWQTGSVQELVDNSMKSAMQLTNNLTRPEGGLQVKLAFSGLHWDSFLVRKSCAH